MLSAPTFPHFQIYNLFLFSHSSILENSLCNAGVWHAAVSLIWMMWRLHVCHWGEEKKTERGSLAELHSWTFNPLILLDYIHTFIRQLSIHVPLFITSVCFWALNLFPFTDERSSHLAVSCLCFLPHPCTLCTILISFPISGTSVRSYPYTFPITQPPARSFSRTACFQHPLADWPVGIKGTVPQRSAWLYSSSATMLSSFVLILRQHKSTHM